MPTDSVSDTTNASRWEEHWRAQLDHGFDVTQDEWREAEQKALSWVTNLRMPQRATIADVCCGRGLEVIELARRGFDAIGVDNSPSAIEIAERLASSRCARLRFVKADLLSLDIGAVDLLTCRDGVLGGVTPASDQVLGIGRMMACLRPGGLLLIDYYDRGYALAHGVEERLFYDASEDAFVSPDSGGQVCALLDFADLILAVQGFGGTLSHHRGLVTQMKPRTYVHTAVFQKLPR